MATLTWTPTTLSWVSVMSTELNSLANAAIAVTSTSVGQINNNGATPATHVLLELALTTVSASASPYITIVLVPENSGQAGVYITNDDVSATYPNYPNVAMSFRTSVLAAHLHQSPPIEIYPMKYRVGVKNNLGVAMNASGNTLKYALLNRAT